MNFFEPNQGSAMLPGQGFNSFMQEAMARGIDDASLTQPIGASGQNVIYEFRQVEDSSSLRKSLNISASASLAGGIGSGSAKASFYNSLEVDSYSIFLFIRVRVSNASRVLKDYVLSDSAVEFLKEFDRDNFFETYGDEFVSGFTTGGELIAILQISNRTVQEKTRTEMALQGSYGTFGGSASFTSALDTVDFHSAKQLYVMRRGGTGPLPDATTLKNLAINFPDSVKEDSGNAVLLQVTTVPYVLATNRPSNISLINLETQRMALERIAELREVIRVARADYRFAAEFPYFFYNSDVNALNMAVANCSAAISQIDDAVRSCLITKGRVFTDPNVSFPKIPLDWTIPLDVPLAVMVHLEAHGDLWGGAHQYLGSKGEGRRIEGVSIAISPPVPGLYIEYFVHGEGYGDTPPTRDGGFVGTRGQNLQLEGIQIRLIGPLAPLFDVVYSAHLEGTGDVQQQNDVFCGTRGQHKRCEGIMISVTRR